jgi:hypothetical protein
MKLTATRDRWALSQDLKGDAESRDFSRLQAAKHAQDVYRIIAMMTMEERDRSSEVVQLLSSTDAFNTAMQYAGRTTLQTTQYLLFKSSG